MTQIQAQKLYDATFWADPGAVHALFAQMRAQDPVHFCADPEFPDFWHVTKHADIFAVEKNTDAFLNNPRLIISDLEAEARIRALTGGTLNLIESLVTMDKPDHPKMRLLTQAWFMPKNLEKLQGRIDASAEDQLKKFADAGGTCDFARDVAVEFPMRVIMEVLGVPASDYDKMIRLTQELFGPQDPDTQRQGGPSDDEVAALFQTFLEFADYFNAMTEDRRENPREDVASIIANAELNGAPISNEYALGYYIIIATAGHDTTSYSLNEAVHQLAQNPDLFARLKADPETMAPKITEEAIRYAAPVRHFVRTAAHDVDLGGKTIKEGQSLILWYPSGSRDEDIFAKADTFDPDRDMSTRHAAFGHAAHMCLGMHLARQEITAFLTKLADRVDSLSLPQSPAYMQATFVGGIKSLPIEAGFQ